MFVVLREKAGWSACQDLGFSNQDLISSNQDLTALLYKRIKA